MLEETANVVNTELDVAVVTPGCAPGILDDEVFLSAVLIGTKADGKDTMIKRSSAGAASDDTRGVLLEDGLISLNGNGGWTLHQSSLELVGVFRGHIGVGLGGDDTLRPIISATEESMGLGNIWVVRLGLEWVGLGVGESSVHHTTVATEVQPGAVNKLLLRERNKVSSFDLMGTFHGSSGGESPA